MRLNVLNKKRLIVSWVLSLSACISPPPDFTACADLGERGHCVSYVTKKKTNPSGEEWRRLRAGAVLLPSQEFANLKTWFDVYCHKNDCPKGIGDWSRFAEELSAGGVK